MGVGTMLLATGIALCGFFVLIYNRLITLKNRVHNGFSQIDVQLQRRYELIPNLVETASAYMQHENDTLTAVTKARNGAAERCADVARDPSQAGVIGALAAAENTLSGALGKFNMVMENYPDLKADEHMRDLHEELASTENRVSFARQAYSDAVMEFNTAREQFPAVLVANALSFKEAEMFGVDEPQVKERIQVSFARAG